jgi:hypothetical protein
MESIVLHARRCAGPLPKAGRTLSGTWLPTVKTRIDLSASPSFAPVAILIGGKGSPRLKGHDEEASQEKDDANC